MNFAMKSLADKQRPTLVLGTAQLGMRYGIANTDGMPSERGAADLLSAATDAGIRFFDTARAYGESERRIGAFLRTSLTNVHVITKLDPMRDVSSAYDAIVGAQASLAASRDALGRNHLDTVLLHRAQHRSAWGGALWNLLRNERNAGGIGDLGVSVQSPSEALAALEDSDVHHLQLPFNLLDWRWANAGVIHALRRRTDVVVHVRSVFLQGLFTDIPAFRWPAIPGLDPNEVVNHLSRLARAFNRRSLADLAIAFVRAQNWIDFIVIGMETREQLASNIALFTRPTLTADEAAHAQAAMPFFPEGLLDPASWPTEPEIKNHGVRP